MGEVRCPCYRKSRKFTVRFCDNLVSGVPSCVVDEFYPDLDPYSFKNIDEYFEFERRIKICPHFVRSDIWFEAPSFPKEICFFFDDSCVQPTISGFGKCSVNCPRFK